MKYAHWTPEQAWVVYQLTERIQESILKHHGDEIAWYQWRRQRMEEYAEQVSRMSEETRIEEGIWLLPDEEDPDDDLPF